MRQLDIPYYSDYLSDELRSHLLKEGKPCQGVPGLIEIGRGGGLENKASLQFLVELYSQVKNELNRVLNQRVRDREFIDKRVKACYDYNKSAQNDFLSKDYKTVLGLEDERGRIVVGPYQDNYFQARSDQIQGKEKEVAPIPEWLQGNHVTLFGPPDSPKMSVNAMNAYHRKLDDEPGVIETLLSTHRSVPKWGADNEDSTTPLRADFCSAGENLAKCFEGTLKAEDSINGKVYELADEKRSLPVKRFPGLALPCSFLFYQGSPLPLHLYDFALHLFHHWHNPEALAFYVPKLENEEEAKYIRQMLETSESMIKEIHPEYEVGTIRLLIVLENPRAVFRVNEIMDEL